MLTFDIPLDKITFDPSNARKHDTKNLEAIKASLKKFGQQKPIVVNEQNIVLAGNGTLSAAKALGWSTITVVRSSLTGHDATAYALADNRTAELAEWDQEILDSQLKALDAFDFPMGDIGFEMPQMGELPDLAGDGEAESSKPNTTKKKYDKNSANDEVDLLMGFKTAINRNTLSAPMKHYQDKDLLRGEVMDFGGGMDPHSYHTYDPYYDFDPSVLKSRYDTICCNYVLNVQAHVGARLNTLLAIRSLLKSEGRLLISVMCDKENEGEEALVRSSRGFQIYLSSESWETEIKIVFPYVKRISSPFLAFECSEQKFL